MTFSTTAVTPVAGTPPTPVTVTSRVWPAPIRPIGPGDDVRALVTGIDLDGLHILLSLKALTPDPFEAYKAAHGTGETITGTVTGVSDRFVDVDLAHGVRGSVHARNLAHTHTDNAAHAVAIGYPITAQITTFNDEHRKVELSVKAILVEGPVRVSGLSWPYPQNALTSASGLVRFRSGTSRRHRRRRRWPLSL